MSWTWDPDKARGNLSKHGVDFRTVELVFADPGRLTGLDPFEDEVRWRSIGRPVPGGRLLFIVYTEPGHDIPGRIISARLATKQERRLYDESIC